MSRALPFSRELALDDPELTLRVEGHFTPGESAQTSGPPEYCHPGSPDEVEIEEVWLRYNGTMQSIELEVSPLLAFLDAFDFLQEKVEQNFANNPVELDEPDYEPD